MDVKDSSITCTEAPVSSPGQGASVGGQEQGAAIGCPEQGAAVGCPAPGAAVGGQMQGAAVGGQEQGAAVGCRQQGAACSSQAQGKRTLQDACHFVCVTSLPITASMFVSSFERHYPEDFKIFMDKGKLGSQLERQAKELAICIDHCKSSIVVLL
eukprot:3940297-Rhodomonas_salina.1